MRRSEGRAAVNASRKEGAKTALEWLVDVAVWKNPEAA